jgi:selT/selW/selH-like putative selenoprotein
VAEEVKKEYNVEAKLSDDNPGWFDVVVNGKTVFSKAKAQRFPRSGEIVEEIRKLN